MPRLGTIGPFKVYMYPDDHPPPHIHVIHAEWIAQVRLVDGAVQKGSLPPMIRGEVADWVARHRTDLFEAWTDVQAHRKPRVLP